MSSFIDKILREAEDSSDDFFQSKHVNKRREIIKKKNMRKRNKSLSELKVGLENVKVAYNNKDWRNDEERYFLTLFSKLHVDNKFYKSKYEEGYCLLNYNNNKECIHDLLTDNFFINYISI